MGFIAFHFVTRLGALFWIDLCCVHPSFLQSPSPPSPDMNKRMFYICLWTTELGNAVGMTHGQHGKNEEQQCTISGTAKTLSHIDIAVRARFHRTRSNTPIFPILMRPNLVMVLGTRIQAVLLRVLPISLREIKKSITF